MSDTPKLVVAPVLDLKALDDETRRIGDGFSSPDDNKHLEDFWLDDTILEDAAELFLRPRCQECLFELDAEHVSAERCPSCNAEQDPEYLGACADAAQRLLSIVDASRESKKAHAAPGINSSVFPAVLVVVRGTSERASWRGKLAPTTTQIGGAT